jgi:5-methylcytosine-specific restriction endonuclease McrA
VYCGQVFTADELTVDHVQPKVKRGDRSGGNLVTACELCNRAKGHMSLARFLSQYPEARENFFRYATFVWPRILRTLE